MKALTASLVLIIIVGTCDAGTWSKNTSHPDFPGMCYYRKTPYEPGEVQNPPGCFRLICSPNGWISGHNCIDSSLEGCERGRSINSNAPFPECCKRVYTCEHGDGTEYEIIDY